jgi:hypothetical protein
MNECPCSCLSYPTVSFLCHIVLSSVACLAAPNFSTLSHKWHDFREKWLNIKCMFWFSPQLSSGTFLILRRIHRDMIINVHRSSRKLGLPFILVDFIETWIFTTDFQKSSNMKSLKIRPVGAKHASRRTDRQLDRQTNKHEEDCRFSKFCDKQRNVS